MAGGFCIYDYIYNKYKPSAFYLKGTDAEPLNGITNGGEVCGQR